MNCLHKTELRKATVSLTRKEIIRTILTNPKDSFRPNYMKKNKKKENILSY
jgi:hypothetical protein